MKKPNVYKDKWGNIRYCGSHKTLAIAVMEKFFRHKLYPGSIVHHKNRDKSNNRRLNLWVFRNQKVHERIHREIKRKYGHW